MADQDYNPNPIFQIQSAEHEDEEVCKNNTDGLFVKIPNSRESESPTVNTPMVRNFYVQLGKPLKNVHLGCEHISSGLAENKWNTTIMFWVSEEQNYYF